MVSENGGVMDWPTMQAAMTEAALEGRKAGAVYARISPEDFQAVARLRLASEPFLTDARILREPPGPREVIGMPVVVADSDDDRRRQRAGEVFVQLVLP